jgi:hypothetical protein
MPAVVIIGKIVFGFRRLLCFGQEQAHDPQAQTGIFREYERSKGWSHCGVSEGYYGLS